jgi:hypothetical protein
MKAICPNLLKSENLTGSIGPVRQDMHMWVLKPTGRSNVPILFELLKSMVPSNGRGLMFCAMGYAG